MPMEVVTTTSKEKRDQMFQDFKHSKDSTPLEKQVVKFSGCQPVKGTDGMPVFREVRYTAMGKGGHVNHGRLQVRQVYESTYSVAYPTS